LVHHDTVQRVLLQAGLAPIGSVRTSRIDTYLPFILETLKKFPDLRAIRIRRLIDSSSSGHRPVVLADAKVRRPPPQVLPQFAQSVFQ